VPALTTTTIVRHFFGPSVCCRITAEAPPAPSLFGYVANVLDAKRQVMINLDHTCAKIERVIIDSKYAVEEKVSLKIGK
jgi:hypothetical protein